MGFKWGLENFNHSLDEKVEKNGSKEIVWNNDDKSFEESQDTYNLLFTEEELQGFEKIDDDDKAVLDATRSKSAGILTMLRESELPDDYYYDAQMLGEATKDVLTQDKLEAGEQDKKIEEQYKEFIEIAEQSAVRNEELDKLYTKIADELEGLF